MVNEPNSYIPNPYTCLGLMPGNSQADIKRRYRQLAKQYHPDRNGHTAASEEKLRDLNAAYAFLSDPARKAAYDASAATMFHPMRVPQPVPSALHVRHRSRSRRVTVSLTLLLLLSTGVSVLFNAVNNSPALSGLLARISGKPAGSDRPAPPYSFLPSKGTFDDSSSSVPSSPASSENAQPAGTSN